MSRGVCSSLDEAVSIVRGADMGDSRYSLQQRYQIEYMYSVPTDGVIGRRRAGDKWRKLGDGQPHSCPRGSRCSVQDDRDNSVTV